MADRPGVCVHAAAHPQRKGLAATTLRVFAGLGRVQLGDFFVQTFVVWQLPACSSAANGIRGCNQCSRFDGNVNGTSRWGACVECRKRPLLISHFVCGGPAEDSKVRYCCCRIDLLDDVCLVSRPPFVKTRKLVLCRSAGHHRERSHPCCVVSSCCHLSGPSPPSDRCWARTGNNVSREYWLAGATTKPRPSTPLDDEDIPPNTLVVEVCECVCLCVCECVCVCAYS